ncbi:MAG: 6-phosphogluconolactonase [Geminocystis sp.]|nr:6-phosphogluconolactonase [Geminocystis sp.]HIK38146.1 6-phosphogluconolactonase [Geminocystis sp. M7585_C2015_104]MCS7148813.1 6-phosphogluconolactonase [Geminocystis sp.]MCX8078447.1 6-phosphogluconolactonase [Geminocystis sp.]MDW8115349.1 6-phosphogluconolactonase [Geminocystis sp.]
MIRTDDKNEVYIVPAGEEFISFATARLAEKISSAIGNRGICTIALAGGSTPKPVYQKLAEEDLPWARVHFFWGDERYVPPTHPESNQKMAREALLTHISIPPDNIHPMPTDGNNPVEDAARYEQHLLDFFKMTSGFPSFDIVLLGMGEDGHTASLFPHTPALTVEDRLVTVGNRGDSVRLTFTVPLINHSRCVIFLVAGENKQKALKAVFSPDTDSDEYPAKKIKPEGNLIWIIDKMAGEVLNAL